VEYGWNTGGIDFLFPWLFQIIQHSNGYIRHAAVKMITHEFGSLTYHIRFPNRGRNKYFVDLDPFIADEIIHNLYALLNQLLMEYHEPRFNRYKYVNSLPPSVYKSLQMVMTELIDMSGIDT
jgi:hypothetical protein